MPSLTTIPVKGTDSRYLHHKVVVGYRKHQKGLMPQDMQSPSSPLARLILNSLKYAHSLKVQIFLSLLGLDTVNLRLRRNCWAFFLKLLSCLFTLLGNNLQHTVRRWASLEGIDIPIQCAMDILSNLCNTDNPASQISTPCA